MGKSDGICKICKNTEETISHLLFDCEYVFQTWSKLQDKINEICNLNCEINKEDVLFCDYIETRNSMFFNFMILEGKWQIWKNRNNVRYGNKISKNPKQIIDVIFNESKYHFEIVLKNSKSRLDKLCKLNFEKLSSM